MPSPPVISRAQIARDSLAYVATEATPGTAETFAAGDGIKLLTPPNFEEVNDPFDLGSYQGGFDRDAILAGTLYGRVTLNGVLRYAQDADDGPHAALLALYNAATMASTVVASTSHTLTPTNDPALIEAARITVGVDHHGDFRTIYGGLVESLDFIQIAGQPIQFNATILGLISGTFATYRPTEQNPVSRTPTPNLTGGINAAPIPFKGNTLTFGGIAITTGEIRHGVRNTLVPVADGAAAHGIGGILIADSECYASFAMLRELLATVNFFQEFLTDNDSRAGNALACSATNGVRSWALNMTGAQMTGFPRDEVRNGLKYTSINLRAAFRQMSHAYS